MGTREKGRKTCQRERKRVSRRLIYGEKNKIEKKKTLLRGTRRRSIKGERVIYSEENERGEDLSYFYSSNGKKKKEKKTHVRGKIRKDF